MKKMAKVMILVLALCLVVPTMCFAAVNISAATVVRTGPTSTTTYVQLTDTGSPPKISANTYFTLPAATANPMLATALTAMSLGKTVSVGLASSAQFANVTYIYVNP